MKLTRKQFELLVYLSENKDSNKTQREMQHELNYSLGTINKLLKQFINLEYVKDNKITIKGLEVLESYRVKRAIFIAAGFGSRLAPVTLDIPKPMVVVNGTRIIDTLIDACINADINEIYIVRGYLSEKFDELKIKYPMIKFLENIQYNEANNISSAFIAKDLMENAYVFESDLLLYNKNIIKKYHYKSDVLGIYKEKTDDWCLTVDKHNNVVEEKIGGKNCYQMVGIYYWNKEDGKRISKHIEFAYNEPGGKERYWETVPNQLYQGEYSIEVLPCNDTDIIEIDTVNELMQIDNSYKSYLKE